MLVDVDVEVVLVVVIVLVDVDVEVAVVEVVVLMLVLVDVTVVVVTSEHRWKFGGHSVVPLRCAEQYPNESRQYPPSTPSGFMHHSGRHFVNGCIVGIGTLLSLSPPVPVNGPQMINVSVS